jgi:hypothetical protein
LSASQPVSITKINWLVVFNEKLDVYSENHKEPSDTLWGQNAEYLTDYLAYIQLTQGLKELSSKEVRR